MFTISKDFTFDASHQLTSLPAKHKCSRLHGHTYTVRVELGAEYLDEHGFVVDFGELSSFGQWIDKWLDHRHLNEVMERLPTSENLAGWLADVLTDFMTAMEPRIRLLGVGVSETPRTWAWWRP